MYLTAEKKKEIFQTYGGSILDTGSSKSQIALFTYRINHLSQHLKNNRKDFNTERSLVKLVEKRKKLLKYIEKKDTNSYKKFIKMLGLRK
ncbi:MAG: 30S ribosomal protein S15 [Flavobacteriales bacterium]|jgi:small subunit ribosomal protein S15|uniref:30S ribosomal protein S15 n=1 Tax=Blattabacterium sp. (Mastotermes darwiniensis) TaxID=39768 RepID=UPI000231DEE4|nr:30S ribosomal protein S15 [Blattabacterium sp. (Mastotermes darwiniensis)]AER40792.1 putative 30S ribosomal protein S15 [Blattabacterium sp. (Mastotermes darwiniensis) str. MADAR]MDR1804637.1 30S ribosomal protein S15 [Flavobacteriales bacterium]